MDNATQALYMAFAMILLVLALSISISLFGQARATSSAIISDIDKTEYVLIEQNENTKSRIVGIETIIPSLYRAFKENYSVRFIDENGNGLKIFRIKNGFNYIETNVLDISPNNNGNQTVVIGNQVEAVKFVDWLVLGKENEFQLSPNSTKSYFRLHPKGVYGIISDRIGHGYSFRETLGLYYQEDIGDSEDTHTSGSIMTSTENVNKTERRIITYTAVKN